MKELDKKIADTLQECITIEQESAQIYLSMAQWLKLKGMYGAGKLFTKYSKAENCDARRVCSYLLDRNVQPIISEIPKPESEFESLAGIVDMALDREALVCEKYEEVMDMSENTDKQVYQWALHTVKQQRWEQEKFSEWKAILTFTPDYIVDKKMKHKA
jgi:ferritin